MVVANLFAAALLAQTAVAAPRADTTAAADNLQNATARVTFDFGTGPSQPLLVRDFELQVSNAGPAAPPASNVPAAQLAGAVQVKFDRTPGLFTPDLAQRGASGQRIPSVTVEVLDPSGATTLTLRLSDVLVASDHVVVNDRSGLEQQRLGLLDAIAQLTSDLQEAERQQNLTEALDKKRLSSSLEVARVHSQVDLLRKRLENQRTRLALLESQIAATGPLDEQVALTFAHFDVEMPGAPPVGYTFEPPSTKRDRGSQQH